MAERTYSGDTAYFPDLGRWLEPGDTVDVSEINADDPRFLTPSEAKKNAPEIKKAQQVAEPAPDSEES